MRDTQKRPIYIKRDIQKRLIYVKRDGLIKTDELIVHASKETHKSETYKRDLFTSKETYLHQKRPIYIKRDLQMRDTQKRPIYINRNIKPITSLLFHRQVMCDLGGGCGAAALRIVYASNETYKRDIFSSKETCTNRVPFFSHTGSV